PCSLPSPSSLPQPPNASRASRWAWVVGLAVTLGLLAWALHDIDPHELGGHLRRADPLLLLAAVALAAVTFPLRTLRWQLILRDAGGKRFPLLPLWHATAIGFMANNLLPVRAGEFARAYAAQQQLPVRFSTALASVGVERVLDGILLVGLMMLAFASPPFPGNARIGTTSISRITVGAALFLGTVLAVAVLAACRPAHPSRRPARGGGDWSLTWRATGYASHHTRSSTCCCASWRAKRPQAITRSRLPSPCSSWRMSSSSPARAPASPSRCTAPTWAPSRPISRCVPRGRCWKRPPTRSA